VEFTARSECVTRSRSAVHWFRAPAAPFALASAVRFSADGLLRSQLSNRRALSSTFAFLQSISQRILAGRPQSTSHSHGLSFPSAHAGSGDPLSAGVATARYVPPSGFGYPLDGFRPPNPRRPYFVPTALLGFTLRSFLLSEGIRNLSARKNPHTVSPTVIPVAFRRQAGPVGRGFWASTLLRVPCERRGVSATTHRILPWVFPLQGVDDDGLRQTFARRPLPRFATTDQP
jgi:hypothetical protein